MVEKSKFLSVRNILKLTTLPLILGFFINCSSVDEVEYQTLDIPSTPKYTLTINAGSGGAVSYAGGQLESGAVLNVTATPNPEYTFTGWSNGSTDNPIQITVTSNQSISANFQKRKYPLTINVKGDGAVREGIRRRLP